MDSDRRIAPIPLLHSCISRYSRLSWSSWKPPREIRGVMQFTSAEMIMAGGPKPLPVEEAFGTVRSVLCKDTNSSREVYAVVVHGKHESSKPLDYLSMMHSVISATIRGWAELWSLSEKNQTWSRAKRSSMIEVAERGGIRIYWGCASPEESKKAMIPTEGVYIFPSHWHQGTLRNLGLEPLPRRFQTSPLVIQVEYLESLKEVAKDTGELVVSSAIEEWSLDRDSLAWRRAFVSNYECLTAEIVADESANTAKNRSAIASRWATEKKIFSIRFENRTLIPGSNSGMGALFLRLRGFWIFSQVTLRDGTLPSSLRVRTRIWTGESQ